MIRPILFGIEPERAHGITLRLIALAGALPPVRALLRAWFAGPPQPVEVMGMHVRNPIGLAAGYDKDGEAWRGLSSLGFGHLEIGTVTPESQSGNPKPRLFRLPGERALINRMGFPGKGAKYVARQLMGERPEGVVLGVNLGMNKGTPLEAAASDYLDLMEVFAPLSDYLAVNVSSPNTIGLRRLQARQALENLLTQLMEKRREQEATLGVRIPILVKLAPDLERTELEDALSEILAAGVDGVIATNTTTSRQGVRSPLRGEVGGLSGAPLRERSTAMIATIARETDGKLPIIGVGGVMSPEDAREKMDAGASLVQLYTGLVYEGPGLVRRILQGL